jgi:predicted DNA-binding transcriptional regulator AlpA
MALRIHGIGDFGIDTATESGSDFRLLSESQAAKVLCLSRACLRHWRVVGQGPPWIRLGARLVRYDMAALRRWIEERAGAASDGT